MINTINKQEALESIIDENLFTAPFMVELVGEEPEYDFDYDTRPDTDDARNRVMKAQILVEVKADEEAISKIEKDYNTYFKYLKSWAKPFDADYYVDSILTTENSITFVFDAPAQEDSWEPEKYISTEDDNEDELASNGKALREIYLKDTVKVINKKHSLYDQEGRVLSFTGEGKGKHAEVLFTNGETELIKVSDLSEITAYVLKLDKENLKELTETKLSSYCMDNATDKKNAIKAIDSAEGISIHIKEKAKDIIKFNESWCLDDSIDQKRFYKKVFNQSSSHTNKFITGIHLSQYTTDAPDGVLMGFDSDAGEMVSYKGKLIPKSELPKKIKIRKLSDGGELEEIISDNEDWKVSGYGGQYIDYKLGTIHKKDDGSFMVKYGVNEVPTGAKTLAEAKSQLDKYSEEREYKSKYSNGGPISESDLSTLKTGFSIKWFREYLDKNFRDSFGFTINKPKKGTQAEQLIAEDDFGGIKDDGLILNFPSNHSMCYKVFQGSENTYFSFLLYDVNYNGYVGSFGFKDKGDVDIEYITRFVALLMQAYGFPFTVKHTVAANGSIVRTDKSALLKYVNFEDNWHINLLELNPNRNQNGLKYKNNNKYAVSRTSDKGKRNIYEFETLEKAEDKFNDLVIESKKFSNVIKEGVTENYKVSEGVEISNYKKQLSEALKEKYNVNIDDTGFDDTHIKLAMDKNESINDVVSFIGNTYNLTPIILNTPSESKEYICVIKDKSGNELGSYPVSHTDDEYLDNFLKSIGVKLMPGDTREIKNK